jgi:hypothetical protein
MAKLKSPLSVLGYTGQSDEKIHLVNANKESEEALLRLLDAYARNDEIDGRWVAIARTHIEQGFMALNRAVFQPERISLPGDED